jgi:hypothetical protein
MDWAKTLVAKPIHRAAVGHPMNKALISNHFSFLSHQLFAWSGR